MDTMDEARRLALARLQLVGVKRVVFARDRGAAEARGYADAVGGAQGPLVSLGVLSVDTPLRDFANLACVARY